MKSKFGRIYIHLKCKSAFIESSATGMARCTRVQNKELNYSSNKYHSPRIWVCP